MRRRLRVRARLTLAYGLTVSAAAAALLAAVYTYLIVNSSVPATRAVPVVPTGGVAPANSSPAGSGTDLLGRLLPPSVIALAAGFLAALAVGWLVAGRLLAPIRRITAAAADIAAGSLDRRVALTGPDDEIKRLADTFDDMLARLEAAFAAQQRFTANASHELLTPLATGRTILEVAAADPHHYGMAELTDRLLTVNARSEQLVEAMLALARAEHGVLRHAPVDVAELVRTALAEVAAEASARGITIDCDLPAATVTGDSALLVRLAENLLRNAVRHNHTGGRVTVSLRPRADATTLVVTNTGPVVPPDQVRELFEPFVKAPSRTGGPGHGLGLAIVRATVAAHDGTVRATPNPGGGLTAAVTLAAGPRAR